MKIWLAGLYACLVMIALACGYYLVSVYWIGAWNGTPKYSDYGVYHRAAVRFVENPSALYHEQGHDFVTGGTFNYPPPAVLPYIPLSALGYAAGFTIATLLSIAAALLSTLLVLRLLEESGVQISEAGRRLSWLVTLAYIPMWQDAKHGQVNAIVLAASLAFLYYCWRGRPLAGTLAMVAGFWLKLYALLTAVALVALPQRYTWPQRLRTLGALALTGATSFALSLVVIPFDLYRQYFLDLFPTMAAYTCPNPMNQSIAGFVARAGFWGPDMEFTDFILMPGWLRTMNSVMLLIALAWVVVALLRTRSARSSFIIIACFLASIPLVSSYGWEYTFMFALPLVLVACVLMLEGGLPVWYRPLVIVCLAALSIPKPNDSMLIAMSDWNVPGILPVLFFSRWTFAAIALGVAVWTQRERLPALDPGEHRHHR